VRKDKLYETMIIREHGTLFENDYSIRPITIMIIQKWISVMEHVGKEWMWELH